MNGPVTPTFGSSGTALGIMIISILIYGWQLFGFSAGLGAVALFSILVLAGNALAISKFNSLKLGTYLRWMFFILIIGGIGLSGMQKCDVNGQCGSVI